MKNRNLLITLALIVLAAGGFAGLRAAQNVGDKTFQGVIADSQCAMSVHSYKRSHKEMMDMRHELKTDGDCARFCVRERGGKFVLESGENAYHLENSEQAEPFAGQRVKVFGVLDPQTNTITVRSITPFGSAGHSK